MIMSLKIVLGPGHHRHHMKVQDLKNGEIALSGKNIHLLDLFLIETSTKTRSKIGMGVHLTSSAHQKHLRMAAPTDRSTGSNMLLIAIC